MMKWLCFLFLGSTALLAQEKTVTPASHVSDPDKELEWIIDKVKDRGLELECLTLKPVYNYGPMALACSTMPSPAQMAEAGPHVDGYIKVYINPASKHALRDAKSTAPVGTLVVVEKSGDDSGREPYLFTAMLKREAGYNSTAGDWEFFALDRSLHISDHGKLESCMKCHQHFSQTDFLSGTLLPSKTR